jgi:hypothetical protein
VNWAVKLPLYLKKQFNGNEDWIELTEVGPSIGPQWRGRRISSFLGVKYCSAEETVTRSGAQGHQKVCTLSCSLYAYIVGRASNIPFIILNFTLLRASGCGQPFCLWEH